MSEEKTFKKLKQLPYEDMLEIYYQEIEKKPVPPVVNLGLNSTVDPNTFEKLGTLYTKDYRPPSLVRLDTQLRILKENGWELEDFMLEVEKRAIIHEVNVHNNNIRFPEELLQRAKHFFPNMKFTEAKLELE